jgi:hypothetical protein
MEGDNVVAVTGLNDLDTMIQLQQGSEMTIRKLLLATPVPGTLPKKPIFAGGKTSK